MAGACLGRGRCAGVCRRVHVQGQRTGSGGLERTPGTCFGKTPSSNCVKRGHDRPSHCPWGWQTGWDPWVVPPGLERDLGGHIPVWAAGACPAAHQAASTTSGRAGRLPWHLGWAEDKPGLVPAGQPGGGWRGPAVREPRASRVVAVEGSAPASQVPVEAGSLPAVLQGAGGLHLELLWAEQLGKGPAEAVVAQRVEDRVDGRVGPQQPEGHLVYQ